MGGTVLRIDPLEVMVQLKDQVHARFPQVSFELQGADEATAVGWFDSGRSGEVRVMVTIADNGDSTIGSGEGLMMELDAPCRSEREALSRVLRELIRLGEEGVELVRLVPALGPLSPSWVGPPGSDEIAAAKRRRFAKVVRRADAWHSS